MKFLITAESAGYLEKVIDAKNENEAQEIMDRMLENGEMPEVGDGSIENEQIQKL